MTKRVAALIFAFVLLFTLTSCGKKEIIKETVKNPDINMDEMPELATGDDSADIPAGDERDLGIDEMPEILDTTVIDRGHRVVLRILPPENGKDYEEGPDYILFEADYRYYLKKRMSPYISVSVDDGNFIPLIQALSLGEVTIEELIYEGLDIQRDTVDYFNPDPVHTISLLVLRIEEDTALCKEITEETDEENPHNVAMYSDDMSFISEGDRISVKYAESQLISGDEEQILYELPPEIEGDEPQTVLFRFRDKLMDINIEDNVEKLP